MTRLLHSALALVALAAVVLAGPIGSGGTAAAAGGAQESRLEREIDRLSSGKRAEVERRIADRLESAGVDLGDPRVQGQLSDVLGVSTGEVRRAVEGAGAPTGSAEPAIPTSVVFLFVAAALIFLPGFLRSIADSVFGGDGGGGAGGVEVLR